MSIYIIFQLYRVSQSYCCRKPEFPKKKSTGLSEVTGKLFHIRLYRVHLS